MSVSEQVASYFWTRSGYLRTSLGQALWTAAGGADQAPIALPAFLRGLADLVEAGGETPADLTAQLAYVAPLYAPTGAVLDDAQEVADALANGAIPPQETLVNFRAWAGANAAGGAVTLPAYVGTIATDDLGALLTWVASSS